MSLADSVLVLKYPDLPSDPETNGSLADGHLIAPGQGWDGRRMQTSRYATLPKTNGKTNTRTESKTKILPTRCATCTGFNNFSQKIRLDSTNLIGGQTICDCLCICIVLAAFVLTTIFKSYLCTLWLNLCFCLWLFFLWILLQERKPYFWFFI